MWTGPRNLFRPYNDLRYGSYPAVCHRVSDLNARTHSISLSYECRKPIWLRQSGSSTNVIKTDLSMPLFFLDMQRFLFLRNVTNIKNVKRHKNTKKRKSRYTSMPWQRQRDIVRQTLKQKNTSTLGGHLILEKCAFSSPLKTHAVQVGFKNLDFKVFLQKKP